MLALRLCSCLLLATTLCAQPLPTFMQFGNVVHAFGGDTVALLDTGLQTLTPLQVVPTGLSAQRLTWDPQHADDLYVWASNGHIYRSTVTAGGVNTAQVTVLPIQGVTGVAQLSWDQSGELIAVGNSAGSQIWRIDRVSGTTTPLLSWPFSDVHCGRQDPSTGDFYLGNNQGVWRVTGVQTGVPSVQLVLPTASPVRSMAFDPLQPQFLLFIRSQDLYRLDTSTLAVDGVWTGAQPLEQIRVGISGDFRAVHGRNVFQQGHPDLIPVGGVPPMLIGANNNIGCCALLDLAVIGETSTPFHLQITSQPGCGAIFEIDNPPVGTSSTWMFFSATTIFPVGTGPFLGIVPDGITLLFMNTFLAAEPGSFLHSLGDPPPVTVIPPGILCFLSGQTWDVVVAAWGPALNYWGRTNVQRLTWQ